MSNNFFGGFHFNICSPGLPYKIRNVNISPQKHESSHPCLGLIGKKQHAALHYNTTKLLGESLHLRKNKESFPVSITQVQGHAKLHLLKEPITHRAVTSYRFPFLHSNFNPSNQVRK